MTKLKNTNLKLIKSEIDQYMDNYADKNSTIKTILMTLFTEKIMTNAINMIKHGANYEWIRDKMQRQIVRAEQHTMDIVGEEYSIGNKNKKQVNKGFADLFDLNINARKLGNIYDDTISLQRSKNPDAINDFYNGNEFIDSEFGSSLLSNSAKNHENMPQTRWAMFALMEYADVLRIRDGSKEDKDSNTMKEYTEFLDKVNETFKSSFIDEYRANAFYQIYMYEQWGPSDEYSDKNIKDLYKSIDKGDKSDIEEKPRLSPDGPSKNNIITRMLERHTNLSIKRKEDLIDSVNNILMSKSKGELAKERQACTVQAETILHRSFDDFDAGAGI